VVAEVLPDQKVDVVKRFQDAGVLYPFFGVLLSPMIAAAAMAMR